MATKPPFQKKNDFVKIKYENFDFKKKHCLQLLICLVKTTVTSLKTKLYIFVRNFLGNRLFDHNTSLDNSN